MLVVWWRVFSGVIVSRLSSTGVLLCYLNMNVYCCLICGKYFQGRGGNTHAYTHSVQALHYIFMNHTKAGSSRFPVSESTREGAS